MRGGPIICMSDEDIRVGSPMLIKTRVDQVPVTDRDFPESLNYNALCLRGTYTCSFIAKTKRGLKENRAGEIVVADNGIATEIRLSLKNWARVLSKCSKKVWQRPRGWDCGTVSTHDCLKSQAPEKTPHVRY
jgi:hypothetical protein